MILPSGKNRKPENQAGSAPKTELHRAALRQISRARTRLLVCFWTLPVYVLAVWVLLDNGRRVDSLMWAYMGLYAIFAVDMARRRCPRCNEQFFVKTILLNLVTHRCVHCHLGPADASEQA